MFDCHTAYSFMCVCFVFVCFVLFFWGGFWFSVTIFSVVCNRQYILHFKHILCVATGGDCGWGRGMEGSVWDRQSASLRHSGDSQSHPLHSIQVSLLLLFWMENHFHIDQMNQNVVIKALVWKHLHKPVECFSFGVLSCLWPSNID